jgi:hypothetical protein
MQKSGFSKFRVNIAFWASFERQHFGLIQVSKTQWPLQIFALLSVPFGKILNARGLLWWPMQLFLNLFWLHTVHLCRYEYKYIRHTLFFAWGLHCGCILKMTGSLLAEELSCCVFGLKSVEELCHAPNRTRTHVSHISGSNGPVSECPPFIVGSFNIMQNNFRSPLTTIQ